MRYGHCYVVLFDLPEALPFEMKKAYSPDEVASGKEDDGSNQEIFDLVLFLEKNIREELHFIGEDVIEGKFYKRFLFTKSGFVEIMYQAPAAIVAHFIDMKRAKSFADALKKYVDVAIKDKKVRGILRNMIEVKEDRQEGFTYRKWSRIKEIRGE